MRGGPARTSKSRRRPKLSRRACFGVQDQREVKRMPRTHPYSIFDILPMVGKIISYGNQWHWFEVQIPSESSGNVKTSQHPESVLVLCHSFCSLGPCIVVEPIRGARPGVVTTLRPIYPATTTLVRFGVLLRLFCQE